MLVLLYGKNNNIGGYHHLRDITEIENRWDGNWVFVAFSECMVYDKDMNYCHSVSGKMHYSHFEWSSRREVNGFSFLGK